MTDGEAALIANDEAVPAVGDRRYETYNPYRTMFDVVWSGRRHVMMGATQVDRFGNQNIAGLGGTPTQPRTQLLGFRGAPGNTINDTTSYWVPQHGPRVFVEAVDIVTGIGYDRAAALGPDASRFHEIRRVVSNLGVFDFETADHAMRLRSVHPGVTVDEAVAATGFELVIPDDVPTSRLPTPEELRLLTEVIDPKGTRLREVPEPE
jgi:acyl CoA:acetate/3-ketoacid CoA transferase beta subunit